VQYEDEKGTKLTGENRAGSSQLTVNLLSHHALIVFFAVIFCDVFASI